MKRLANPTNGEADPLAAVGLTYNRSTWGLDPIGGGGWTMVASDPEGGYGDAIRTGEREVTSDLGVPAYRRTSVGVGGLKGGCGALLRQS